MCVNGRKSSKPVVVCTQQQFAQGVGGSKVNVRDGTERFQTKCTVFLEKQKRRTTCFTQMKTSFHFKSLPFLNAVSAHTPSLRSIIAPGLFLALVVCGDGYCRCRVHCCLHGCLRGQAAAQGDALWVCRLFSTSTWVEGSSSIFMPKPPPPPPPLSWTSWLTCFCIYFWTGNSPA